MVPFPPLSTSGPTSVPTSGPTLGPTSGPTLGPTSGPTLGPTSGSTSLSSFADGLATAAKVFAPASTELQNRRELLRRVDTKYVCFRDLAHGLLAELATSYVALPVASGNIATYQSMYFDTPERRCFHDHRRGRRLRHKIRIRHYPDRRLSFLEVKTKRNEVVTDKRRLALGFGATTLGTAEQQFLREIVPFSVEELRPVLQIDFLRLSLLALGSSERVTLDFELSAHEREGARWSFGERAVIEVKQAPFCVRTPIMRALAAAGLREQSMSKYTIATAMMHPELRRNRLLPDLRALRDQRTPRDSRDLDPTRMST